MSYFRKSVFSAVLYAMIFFGSPSTAIACEDLQALALPETTITLAQPVKAGAFMPPQPGAGGSPGTSAFRNVPAFCRVAATLSPSSDSEIKIEVWMPLEGWNGKFQGVGNGAWGGTIVYNALAGAVTAGYAAASTDTGHDGRSPAFFALNRPEKLIDFAHRAIHEMTVAAKAIVAAHYGTGPLFSYFTGCSTGGRQAMAEAQRYPDDYDGILAGAIVNYPSRIQATQIWTGLIAQQALNPPVTPSGQAESGEGGVIPESKFALIHNAVLQQCDAIDGVNDGVIENPAQCRFDPQVLECRDGEDGASCLTAAEVEVVRKMYEGPKNPRTGESIYTGAAAGSELGWPARLREPTSLAIETYKYLVFQDPNWDFRTFDIETDTALAEEVIGPIMDSTDPDLRPFFERGGKLLLYHGWNDAGVSPFNTISYYESVVNEVGPETANDSIRLFMVPGMGHCRGGEGPDTFDGIGTLDRWVERGEVPDRIMASRIRNAVVDRTRPLCSYPHVAVYNGSGSTDDGMNFTCRAQ